MARPPLKLPMKGTNANPDPQTDDGRASLLDLIRHAIAGRGERRVLSDLRKQHPELDGLISSVRFPDACGHIQKTPTPVVDLEGWLQILPLLPGAADLNRPPAAPATAAVATAVQPLELVHRFPLAAAASLAPSAAGAAPPPGPRAPVARPTRGRSRSVPAAPLDHPHAWHHVLCRQLIERTAPFTAAVCIR